MYVFVVPVFLGASWWIAATSTVQSFIAVSQTRRALIMLWPIIGAK